MQTHRTNKSADRCFGSCFRVVFVSFSTPYPICMYMSFSLPLCACNSLFNSFFFVPFDEFVLHGIIWIYLISVFEYTHKRIFVTFQFPYAKHAILIQTNMETFTAHSVVFVVDTLVKWLYFVVLKISYKISQNQLFTLFRLHFCEIAIEIQHNHDTQIRINKQQTHMELFVL